MRILSASKELPFYKLSPGGNPTVLIPAETVPPCERAAVAAAVMSPLHLGAEQVGFVDLDEKTPSLEMMGGEFCGNACRATAALLAMLNDKGMVGTALEGFLSASGADDPVAFRVRPCEDGEPGLDAAVRSDLSCARVTPLEAGLILVDIPGITHILLDESLFPAPADPAADAAAWRANLKLDSYAAVGCIRHAPLEGAGLTQRITPLVWVRDTNSSCPESGCGSGSLALALALHARTGLDSLIRIRQPSGADIVVSLEQGAASGVFWGWIGGTVRLIAQGKIFVA